MDTFTSGAQLKISTQLGFALGPLGREMDSSLELDLAGTNAPPGATICFAFSQGL
jgi:hypothetical protein